MGKKKQRQIQIAAQQRGYQQAVHHMNRELGSIQSEIHSLRLTLETSGSITRDAIAARLKGINRRLNKVMQRSNDKGATRKPNILDLQNPNNKFLDTVDPMEVVDDEVIDFLIDKEFEQDE